LEAERTLGAVDVFIGHSLGGGTGAWSVYDFFLEGNRAQVTVTFIKNDKGAVIAI
jgi:hypothetical protein